MIPLQLTLSGFLSYRDQVEIDFTKFDLASITGANGAGKSSLLDAITWALFGVARKRDDSVINLQSIQAEVCLAFAYENNVYRIRRLKPKEKTGLLEFHILQSGNFQDPDGQTWKPLTERTLRETEALIQRTLRLDYDTFVNAAFFLQGKADQFTQQRSSDRKRILGTILGLEVWEIYRQRAGERRRLVENAISETDALLREIQSELAEEAARKSRLEQLEADLKRLSKERQTQEKALENIRQLAATLEAQRKMVNTLARQLEGATRQLAGLDNRLELRRQERQSQAALLARAAQIEGNYQALLACRAELERWEAVAAQFREQEKRREAPRDEINAAKARLLQEQQTLQQQAQGVEASQKEIVGLGGQIETVQAALDQAEARAAQRSQLDSDLQEARQRQAEARAENPRLRSEMEELKARITQLKESTGASCPVCGQPLSETDRTQLIAGLETQGRELGDRFRSNNKLVTDTENQVRLLETQLRSLNAAQEELNRHQRAMGQLTSRRELLQAQYTAWLTTGQPRLQTVTRTLVAEDYAPEARARLAEIDVELKAIGYDAAQHDAVRRQEQAGRPAEAEIRKLEQARAALAPLEREISELETQAEMQRAEVRRQQEEHDHAAAALAAAQATAPDLNQAEDALFSLQEQENRMRLEVGAARQKVLVLEDMKARRRELERKREGLARQVGQYKQLERAFSKDGVPALLIEQALPEIELRANEILDRLSNGSMSVRFVTQSAYKDKKREDLKETLDIQISDAFGTRDYEMYSGGEAFRVNFAIRLALSEVLAQRAGARLQTLVVDEGFGSQDAEGRQRLIEAINLVRQDFAKILVITHIDELKDAFPNRIEVEKSDRGSQARVV